MLWFDKKSISKVHICNFVLNSIFEKGLLLCMTSQGEIEIIHLICMYIHRTWTKGIILYTSHHLFYFFYIYQVAWIKSSIKIFSFNSFTCVSILNTLYHYKYFLFWRKEAELKDCSSDDEIYATNWNDKHDIREGRQTCHRFKKVVV